MARRRVRIASSSKTPWTRGLSISSVIVARHRLKEAGIRACFFLQLGYPGETWTELQETIAFVRQVRPDDIGVSFSYPLPGTVFYERVHAQLGRSATGPIATIYASCLRQHIRRGFYRAVRDALHAEVDSWHEVQISNNAAAEVKALWQRVNDLEPVSRDEDAFMFPERTTTFGSSTIIPAERLVPLRGA